MPDSTQPGRCECRGICGCDHGFRCAVYFSLTEVSDPGGGKMFVCKKCLARIQKVNKPKPTRQHRTPQMADTFDDCELFKKIVDS
jgi:hypothetical protein